jgi:nucleoside-diphosphate-sugar epimerase
VRIFVTGATGYVGSHLLLVDVVPRLVAAALRIGLDMLIDLIPKGCPA